MNKIKILSAIVFSLCAALAPAYGYAVNFSDISVNQGDLVFYIIIIGAVFILIGAICIIMSLFVKSRAKTDKYEDLYYDDESDDYDEFENYDESDDCDCDSDVTDEVDKSEAVDDMYAPETESDNSCSDEDADVTDEDSVAEEFEDEAVDTEANEENESAQESENNEERQKGSVMITLSGINNPEVKIVEFTDYATVGRRNTNSLMLADNAVSGVHCRFIYENGEVLLEDMGSTNGTAVNDEKITSVSVKSGDTVIIGKCKYRINISIND